MKRLSSLRPLFLLALCLTPAAWAGTLVDFSASATEIAPNDLVQVTVFAEASGPTPQALASQINRLVAEAGDIAKGYDKVKRQSGQIFTQPVYDRDRITAWRTRAELELTSQDIHALSALLGRLQEKLGVTNIRFTPTPEARKAAEEKAVQNAIAAFQSQAEQVARTLGKPYTIRQLNIQTADNAVRPLRAMAPKSSFSETPMTMEAGESQIRVTISGQIELAE
jgi:predicted secreted protein